MVATPVINNLAVLAAALCNIAIGFLWYGPLFGKAWIKLMGFTEKTIKHMKMTPLHAMIGGAIASVIMAYVLAIFVDFIEITNIAHALMLGFWIWLGFIAPVQVGVVLWEGKPWKLFWLNTTHYLVSICIMSVTVAVWV